LKDLAETVLFVVCLAAAVRRGVYRPARYRVPERYGKDRTAEAVGMSLLLALIVLLEMGYEGSLVAAGWRGAAQVHFSLIPLSAPWGVAFLLSGLSTASLQVVHIGSYYAFSVLLFTFVCLLPFGRLFHILIGVPNVFLKKRVKGSVKPVRWGVSEEEIDSLESFGVKTFEDFTWKHMLDFYACADCGRCSDNCPANAVGRPLSPRFVSIKARSYMFQHYPVRGDVSRNQEPLMGSVYDPDEIWSCTTCGACEEECPVTIEYIDKMVDLRRGMVDEGMVPQSIQKALGSLEKRGNPYGKVEKKRAEWTKEMEPPVRVLGKKDRVDTLFFVDSASSFDDQVQDIARDSVRVLTAARADFGVLGPLERDSGHEVRRFGEEMLFMELRDRNTEAILATGARQIVTADPHAFNALKKDYRDLPPVLHMSEFIANALASDELRLGPDETGKRYTYHDPCYLGRHNEMYDTPRQVLDAISGLQRVEMIKCRDRSFCCGGGGLMLFYEPVEETRMGALRVAMAREAGADVIVTACPFCKINLADAIKTSGLEGQMEVIDLVELVCRHLAPR
jgi:Fe-S oxidoreductase